MKISAASPKALVDLQLIPDQQTREAIRGVLRLIEEMKRLYSIVVNFNEISYADQNDPPTLVDGQVMVWKDADAMAGDPQAYIITQQDGNVWTFASVEVV